MTEKWWSGFMIGVIIGCVWMGVWLHFSTPRTAKTYTETCTQALANCALYYEEYIKNNCGIKQGE